jgi:hypothetical protein
LVLRQASIRSANLSLTISLATQSRLSILDSHLDIASIEVEGPVDARVDIDGGWVRTSDGALRSKGPTVQIREGGGQPLASTPSTDPELAPATDPPDRSP